MNEHVPAQVRQTHGVPALMSFFMPGLGQLTKGHGLKAIVTFIAFWAFTLSLFGIPIAIVIWLWNIADAYNS